MKSGNRKRSKKIRQRKSKNQKTELWNFYKKLNGRTPKREQIIELVDKLQLKEQ